MATTFEIHPAIGIARVGNSVRPDGFFFGPEPGVNPPAQYRDADGALLRQAARFRMYRCERDAAGKLTSAEELAPADARVTWTVHLVNRKRASPNFLVGGAVNTDPNQRRNNASGDDTQDRALILDPGAGTVEAARANAILQVAYHGRNVLLGELRFEAAPGRLIVLGGQGRSESLTGEGIGSFAENESWFDDVADGSVSATITLVNGDRAEARPAWVIVAPPDFAPGIANLVTLYDALLEQAIQRGLGGFRVPTPPVQPSYPIDILPILQRVMNYGWVNRFARQAHGPGGAGDFTSADWAGIDSPAGDSSLRQDIFGLLRDPASGTASTSVKAMPRLFSNDYPHHTPLPLTSVQYGNLAKWAAGNFTAERRPVAAELEPELVTRVALEACVGGAFWPGIEAGRILRDKARYFQDEPFRLDPAKVRPGELTGSMALPWQADFFDCQWEANSISNPRQGMGWWPAQRPDDVFPDNGGATMVKWDEGVTSGEAMVRLWARLGFVVNRGTAQDPNFRETERSLQSPNRTPAAQVHARAAAPGNAMPPARKLITGLSRPVFLTSPPGDTNRLFIVEQHTGLIRIFRRDLAQLNALPFLRVSDISQANEQGLLGLAFDLDYDHTGFFFVSLTNPAGAVVVRRYSVSMTNPDLADPASATPVIAIPHPFSNHNGGWIAFGKDRMLFIGLGDGGSEGDPNNRSQDIRELLGKMLRIDVGRDEFPNDPEHNYGIPADNPFVRTNGARPEIWALGLRNPWRCSFDRDTGDLWIGDVGQDTVEEVDFQPANSKGGENYGWSFKEGSLPFKPPIPAGLRLQDPILEYQHDVGIAIIGGYVYRGKGSPALQGTYFFGDLSGPIWTSPPNRANPNDKIDRTAELFPGAAPLTIASFGEDADGELYLLNLTPGEVYQVTASAPTGGRAHLAASQPGHQRHKGLISTLRWETPGGPRPVTFAAVAPLPGAPGPLSKIQLPEVPPEHAQTAVDEAIYLLKVASEVEHGLLVQYLYAAYSLNTAIPEASGWALKIANIAVEEMFHLVNVQNILLTLKPSDGSTPRPYFDRGNFPIAPDLQGFYPFPFMLEPVSKESLAKYVAAESPSDLLGKPDLSGIPAAELLRLQEALQIASTVTKGKINHVGLLYAKLYWMFQDDDTPTTQWKLPPELFPGVRHVPPNVFVANPAALLRQGSVTDFTSDAGTPNLPGDAHRVIWTIRSKEDVRNAINQIAAQGEGTSVSTNSHFLEFFEIYQGFVDFKPTDGLSPVLPVPVNPNTGGDPGTAAGLIDNEKAAGWARLFNLRYQMLLAELFLLLSEGPDENPDAENRDLLVSRVLLREMKGLNGVKGLARVLGKMPQHPSPRTGGPAAAAPFELPAAKPSDQQRLLLDLIDASSQMADALLALKGDSAPTTAETTQLNSLKSGDVAFRNAVAAMKFTDPSS